MMTRHLSKIWHSIAMVFSKIWHVLEKVHTFIWLFGLTGFAAYISADLPLVKTGWQEHPMTTAITFGLIVLLVVFLYFSISALIRRDALFNRVGIILTGGYPSNEADNASKYRNSIRSLIDDDLKNSRQLRILGSTGFNTFAKESKDWQGGESAFLYKTLREADEATKIDILLLHPQSSYLPKRVAQLKNVTIDEYRNEIFASIKSCAELKKLGKQIRCYLYRDRPLVWKLIISDNYVWQQAYPDDTHVEYSAVNLFKRKDSNKVTVDNSLYAPLSRLFDLLRDDGCGVPIDLDNVEAAISNLTEAKQTVVV